MNLSLKNTLTSGLSLLLLFTTFSLHAVKGEIVVEKGDYYLVETSSGYTVMERYHGAFAYEGDKVVGNLNSYGFKDIYDVTKGSELRVYIEDYSLDEEDAMDLLYELSD